MLAWGVHRRDEQGDVEKQVACERLRGLREEFGPEHRTAVPGRLGIYLNLDALFLVRDCKCRSGG